MNVYLCACENIWDIYLINDHIYTHECDNLIKW